MREQLVKRYQYLMSGEMVSMVLFVGLFVSALRNDGWHWREWLLRGYGLLSLLIILGQGVYL